MLKKVLSLSLVLAMVLTVFVGAVDYKDADDISDGAKSAVELVGYLGLMAGDANGNFRPQDPITREEVFRVLASLYEGGKAEVDDLYAAYLAGSDFDDVADVATWAENFAGFVASKQIVAGRTHKDGVEGKYLDPKGNITYLEMVVLLVRSLGYGADYFDFTGTTWANKVSMIALEKGLFAGIAAKNWGANATREDVAIMFVNAMGKDFKMVDRKVLLTGEVTYEEKVPSKTLFQDKYKATSDNAASVKLSSIVTKVESDKYTLASGTVYTLAKGETADYSVLGKEIVWSERKGTGGAVADRIKNAEVTTAGWTSAEVSLDSLTISATSVKVGSAAAKTFTAVYFVGNGVNKVNEDVATIKDAMKVTVSTSKDYAVISGVYGAKYKIGEVADKDDEETTYDIEYPTVAVGSVVSVDEANDLVLVNIKNKYENGTDTAGAFGNRVYKVEDASEFAAGGVVKVYVDYHNALLGNNKALAAAAKKLDKVGTYDDKGAKAVADAEMTVLAPVKVEGGKFITSGSTYYLNGSAVDASAFSADGFTDIDDYYDDDSTKTFVNVVSSNKVVYKDGKYLYLGADGATGTIVQVAYQYGAIVDSNYTADGSTVTMLTTAGDKVVLPINKIKGKAPEAGSYGFDDKGNIVAKVKEITGAATTNIIATYVKVGDKYDIYVGIETNAGETLHTSLGKTANTTVTATTATKKIAFGAGAAIDAATVDYDSKTPVFVWNGGKISVMKAGDFAASTATFEHDKTVEQTYINALVKPISAGSSRTTTSLIVVLPDASTAALVGIKAASTRVYLLAAISYDDAADKLTYSGIVDGALVLSKTVETVATTLDVSAGTEGKFVEIAFTDGKVSAVNAVASVTDKLDILEYIPDSPYADYKDDIIVGDWDDTTDTYKITSSSKVYCLTKAGFVQTGDDQYGLADLAIETADGTAPAYQAIIEYNGDGEIVTMFTFPVK